jgi:heptosyltransferase III
VRLLVIRRDNIGDLVCTTPLFAALRARYPQAHIAALVNSYNAAVLDGNPHVDAVHFYTKLKHRRPGQSALGVLAARLKMVARLRAEPFDTILLAKSGVDRHGLATARRLRGRDIAGFAPPGAAPRGITRPVPEVDYQALHEVEVMAELGRALDVPQALGPVRVYPDRARVRKWAGNLPENKNWVALHISARLRSRLWPSERWIALARRLAAEGHGLALFWSPGAADDPRHPGDDARAAAIAEAAPVVPVRTEELGDLIAALSLCNAFIGADGGAMHIAAGLGLPIVAFFDSLQPKNRRWRPWQVPHQLVVPPGGGMSEVSLEQTLEAWRRLDRLTPPPARTPAPSS